MIDWPWALFASHPRSGHVVISSETDRARVLRSDWFHGNVIGRREVVRFGIRYPHNPLGHFVHASQTITRHSGLQVAKT